MLSDFELITHHFPDRNDITICGKRKLMTVTM